MVRNIAKTHSIFIRWWLARLPWKQRAGSPGFDSQKSHVLGASRWQPVGADLAMKLLLLLVSNNNRECS